jgi:tetratricopeptide (TPR) repeat protein
LYRARLALACGQKNNCKKELKACSELIDSSCSVQLVMAVACLRAQFYFSLSDFNNSLEMIASIAQCADHTTHEEQSNNACVVYFNNLGCVHFKMKKLNAALYYFSKALIAEEKSSLSNHIYFECVYNAGLTLAVLGKSQLALDCFAEVLQGNRFGMMKSWLRMAECAIQYHVSLLKVERRCLKTNLGVESGKADRSVVVLPGNYSVIDHSEKAREFSSEKAREFSSLRHALERLINARALLATTTRQNNSVSNTQSLAALFGGLDDGCNVRNAPFRFVFFLFFFFFFFFFFFVLFV